LTSLAILEAGVAVKDNVYLRKNTIKLNFQSKDRSRAELAARLLKLASVDAEVKSMLTEGWPRYHVGLKDGALVIRFSSTDPDSIQQVARRFREMGLVNGRHFAVKIPEEGRGGYVSILKEGLAYAAWLSVHDSGERQRLAARFVKYILERAEEAGKEVYEKANKIIEEDKTKGSLKLEGFEGRVEVGGREYVVRVVGGGAEFDQGGDGRKLLRLRITAEVDSVKSEYTITYGRYGEDNAAVGFATARADAPGAERQKPRGTRRW
jgi:hypothetical protein